MSKEEVFEIMKENIIEIIPELSIGSISINNSLKEIGANSVDRADIIMYTLESLDVKVSMVKFADCENMSEIIDIMLEAKNA